MTLSSTSRQHRKSMLPTPRLSSRISSRRVALGDTSRIARRVPSPLLAPPYNDNGSIAQARIPLNGLGTWHAGSPSRIPGPSGQMQASCLMQEKGGGNASSSLINTPRLSSEVKKTADAQYPTPPSSAGPPKDEQHLKGQEGRLHHHNTATRRPASTALTAGFSRVENTNTSPGDGGTGAGALLTLARKKSALSSSVSGKENRRPQILHARVPAPPVVPVAAAIGVLPQPRSIRRTVAVVAQPSSHGSFRETLPRPLVVIKKRPFPLPAPGSTPQGDARVRVESVEVAAAPAVTVVPVGVKVLMEDIDRFAKEWTEMFDGLSAGAPCSEGGPSMLVPSTHVHPTGQPEVTPASLARRQHRNKAMIKDSPVEDEPERDLPALVSDPPSDGERQHPEKVVVLRNAASLMTPRASRYHPILPEINQSPIISGSHLSEMTSVGSLDRKDEFTKLPESHPTTPRGTDTARRNGITHNARYYPPTTPPSISFSPFSTTASLSSASSPYAISPWVNLQGHDFIPRRSVRAASDAAPTRSSSLRGLRAIFKRTSAGLTGGQRQRAESLKERISEPRVLSLGSISIANLQDAGVARGCGPEEGAVTTGELARKTTVKW